MAEREFRVLIHEEDGLYWAEVAELPGCFASGANLDELRVAVVEAISLYVSDDAAPATHLGVRARDCRGDARPRIRLTRIGRSDV